MARRAPDKPTEPDAAQLVATLGPAKRHWDAIVAHVDGLDGVARSWKLYAGKHGWQLRVRDKKSALLYLIPHPGSFMAALPLDDRAVRALPRSGLPADVVAAIQAAKPAMEGRPARIEVTAAGDVAIVQALLALSLDARGRRAKDRAGG